VAIGGCQNADDAKNDHLSAKAGRPTDTVLSAAADTASRLSESKPSSAAPLVALTQGMISWYKQNDSMLEEIQMFSSPDSLRGAYTYRIRQSGLDEYLSLLLKSGFFSEKYVASERAYYKKMDSTLIKNKHVDGPAEGVEGNRVFWTQDVYGDLAMDSLFTYRQVGDTVFVVTPEKTLCFGYDERKKIQSIEPRFPD
jgi:hypothetical protein